MDSPFIQLGIPLGIPGAGQSPATPAGSAKRTSSHPLPAYAKR